MSIQIVRRCLAPLLVATVLASSWPLAAQQRPRDACSARENHAMVSTATYTSLSGRYSLEIRPQDREGVGPGHYELTRGEDVVWGGELPFTLHDAVVSDSGRVAGCGFAHETECRFIVAAISESGAVQWRRSYERGGGNPWVHGPPRPRQINLFAQPGLGRLVLRVRGYWDSSVSFEQQKLWIFDLETGERADVVELIEPRDSYIPRLHLRELMPVAGGPLVLARWRRRDREGLLAPDQLGARFALFDADWNEVWELVLPTDYTVSGDEAASERLARDVDQRGATRIRPRAGIFDLHFVAEERLVTFEAAPDDTAPTGWHVTEIGRRPWLASETPPPPTVEFVDVELEELEPVTLRVDRPDENRPIRDVIAFDFTADGGIEFVRQNREEEEPTIVRLDRAGRLLSETKVLGKGELDWLTTWVRLDAARWLALPKSRLGSRKAVARFVDAASGVCRPVPDFASPTIEEVEATRAGGFVTLTDSSSQNSGDESLRYYDAEGRLVWMHRERDYATADSHVWMRDVAVDFDGRVLVLDTGLEDCVLIYDSHGELQQSVDLEQAWDRDIIYITELFADVEGGFLVHDNGEEPPLWRTSAEGKLRSAFQPLHVDGRKVPLPGHLRVTPDGSMWTTDGDQLLRLNDAGRVVEAWGQAASPSLLYETETCHLDRLGRICVADRRTRAVHVFDRQGERLFVAVPSVEAFDQLGRPRRFAVDHEGSLHVGPMRGTPHFAVYGAAGAYLGRRELGELGVCFDPKGDRYWRNAYTEVQRLDAHGAIEARVRIRSDGEWIEEVESLAVDGKSGSLALNDGSFVATYSADGEPQATYRMPKGVSHFPLKWSGDWILFRSRGVFFLRPQDGAAFRFSWPQSMDSGGWTTIGLSPEGDELWILEDRELRLRRFKMPR